MQRRWAAICIAFFLVTAGGAYAVMATAEAPEIDVQGDRLGDGDSFRAGGHTYAVTVDGGTGSLARNRTVEATGSFANNTVIDYRNASYNVSIEPAADPRSFTLIREYDVEAILAADPAVENSTYTRENGSKFVLYHNGTTQPLSAYLDRETVTLQEGETIEHAGYRKTIGNVTSSAVPLTWQATQPTTIGLEEGGEFTIGDTQYVATFPDNDTVVVTSNVEAYTEEVATIEYFHRRISGLLYVVLFSLGSGFLLAALSFMPHRG